MQAGKQDSRVKAGGKAPGRKASTASAGKVVDLMDALPQSLKAGGSKKVAKKKGGVKQSIHPAKSQGFGRMD